VRAAMDRGRAEAAEIYVNGFVVDERVRRTSDVSVDTRTVRLVEQAFASVRAEVSGFFGVTLSAAEGPGFLRYLPEASTVRIGIASTSRGRNFTRSVSLVLFLTDTHGGTGDGRCEGGTLRLYDVIDPAEEIAPLDISPAAGTLVAFRSHLLHEVLPVTGGVRDAIVDWFY
jgi:predicted 2-oxoglutarate/Fe(II)-dependent dioxygenase YbiX